MGAYTKRLKAFRDKEETLVRRGVRYLRSWTKRYYRRVHKYSADKYQDLLGQLIIVRRLTLARTTFIAVTGSVGKTTAARLMHEILSSQGACHAQGGRNSVYASILAVRSVARSCKFCVQEIGADKPGAIAEHVRVLRPDIGIVTTIGGDHYKEFRTLEATAIEKGHLVECLPRHGVAILNADDERVLDMARRTRARVLTFGRSPNADVTAREVSGLWPDRLRLTVAHGGNVAEVKTMLVGEHWVTSALAAIACGLACGIDLRTCAAALAQCEPAFGRYSVHTGAQGQSFIMDHVKAPVWTIPIGLTFVAAARAPCKTIVFGTLSDYPSAASKRYRRTAREALEVANRVVFVGRQSGHVEKLRQGPLRERLFNFDTAYQASAFLAAATMPGELIYIKASQTDHLERIMLMQLDEVVCWREPCGVRKGCQFCGRFRKASPPPFGVEKNQRSASPAPPQHA